MAFKLRPEHHARKRRQVRGCMCKGPEVEKILLKKEKILLWWENCEKTCLTGASWGKREGQKRPVKKAGTRPCCAFLIWVLFSGNQEAFGRFKGHSLT